MRSIVLTILLALVAGVQPKTYSYNVPTGDVTVPLGKSATREQIARAAKEAEEAAAIVADTEDAALNTISKRTPGKEGRRGKIDKKIKPLTQSNAIKGMMIKANEKKLKKRAQDLTTKRKAKTAPIMVFALTSSEAFSFLALLMVGIFVSSRVVFILFCSRPSALLAGKEPLLLP